MNPTMMKTFNSLVFLIIFLFPFFVYGEEFSISTKNNLILELRPGQKVTAGFMDITVSENVNIIKIESKLIDNIEAHSMIMDGEIMKMRKIKPELKKNIEYKFQPGGDHLMFYNVSEKLKKGDNINLLFTFELKNQKRLSKSIQFKVK